LITKVKTDEEIKNIRESGKMLATVLDMIKTTVEPGMSGIDIDKLAEKEVKSLGGKAAFHGYMDFPGYICISSNENIVHGIPSDIEFKKGDLVGFDFGVICGGMITDSAITLAVGGTDDKENQRLLDGTLEALMAGIKVIKGETLVGDISAAIEAVLNRYKFGIIRTLVGHGVGHEIHEEPNIPNYGKAGTGMSLRPGMTIAIEPMATLGGDDVVTHQDGWTIKSLDDSMTAHFEHTVLITDSGFEILTQL